MELFDILAPEAVKVISQSSSKKRLFRDLAEQAEASYGLDANTIIDALLDRETLGPTGVGNGIALPHARLESLCSKLRANSSASTLFTVLTEGPASQAA